MANQGLGHYSRFGKTGAIIFMHSREGFSGEQEK
jgi:hypothetical protein